MCLISNYVNNDVNNYSIIVSVNCQCNNVSYFKYYVDNDMYEVKIILDVKNDSDCQIKHYF